MPELHTRQAVVGSQEQPALLGWMGRAIPTVLVLGALACLGYWGHYRGWKLPKFSALTGNGRAEKDDWCEAHGVPESLCVECQPGLYPRLDFGWCQKHGVHDCPFEHPEVAQLKEKPAITPADLDRADRALRFVDRPENNAQCKLHQRRLQFASREAVEKAGIDVAPVKQAPISESISANGEVTYDQTRVARLSARVPGTVWRVEKELGVPVQKGEVLALIDALQVGQAKSDFLQALAQVDLRQSALESMREAFARGSVSQAKFRETEASLREAQIRLVTTEQALVNLGLPIRAEEVKRLRPEELAQRVQFLGLPESIVHALDPRSTTANLLPIKAPLEGLVIAREAEAVAGQVVDSSKLLFTVADTRRMWLTLNVRLEDAKKLEAGKPVRFRPDGGGQEISGKVSWISTAVDEKTRTLRLRADLDNTTGQLRANTFGTGKIILREEPKAIVVPSEAVQREGEADCQVVFVRDKNYFTEGSPKIFHVRTVRVGARDDLRKVTEIIAGLLPREVVVTKGSGALRAELLKNNLGEG